MQKLLLLIILVIFTSGCICITLPAKLIFGGDQRDLGVRAEPSTFSALAQRNGFNIQDSPSAFCLECDITYANPQRVDLTLTSEELSSYLQATNNEKGKLKDIQVRLLDDNMAEVSAMIDLTDEGYDFQGPVYAKGNIQKSGSNRISLEFDESQAGELDAPEDIQVVAQDRLEDEINHQLGNMPGLTIDTLEIQDGKLRYQGTMPTDIGAG